jgi:hypothetical protein
MVFVLSVVPLRMLATSFSLFSCYVLLVSSSLAARVQLATRQLRAFDAILSSFTGYTRRLLWVLFWAQSYALWNTRNKLAIEKTLSNPAGIIYKTIIFLQLRSLTSNQEKRRA